MDKSVYPSVLPEGCSEKAERELSLPQKVSLRFCRGSDATTEQPVSFSFASLRFFFFLRRGGGGF